MVQFVYANALALSAASNDRTVTQYGCKAGEGGSKLYDQPEDNAPASSNNATNDVRDACHPEPSHHSLVSRSKISNTTDVTPTSSVAEPSIDTGADTDDQFAGDDTETPGAVTSPANAVKFVYTYGDGLPAASNDRTVTQYGCDATLGEIGRASGR